MNTFINELSATTNYKRTENGAVAHKKTGSAVYDMFALGGAYRSRSASDCITLFANAYAEDKDLALKCLFYIRDVRGGQGERRFFRLCFEWLCRSDRVVAERLIHQISEFGRWDDVLYSVAEHTPAFEVALNEIKQQLALDIQSKTPSLLAKWLPSENASSLTTREMGNKVRTFLGMSHKQYRKTLATLRAKIKIVERLMSENRWDEIEFDKIPSRAGFIYRNAFARRDIIAKKYEAFAKNENTKVNASVLYPYEIFTEARLKFGSYYRYPLYSRTYLDMNEVDRAMLNKYWANLPDYLNGKPCKMMCVVDTSGSMTVGVGDSNSKAQALDVALSLGMYTAERLGGDFKNKLVTFSNSPQFIQIEGSDFVDKARRLYGYSEVANTDLVKTFDLLFNVARNASPEDVPDTLVIISDMEIDCATYCRNGKEGIKTTMERVRDKWEAAGLKMPHLVYWNCNARKDTILDLGPNVSCVSGMSPTIFESVISGKTGYDLMLEKINSERYKEIHS